MELIWLRVRSLLKMLDAVRSPSLDSARVNALAKLSGQAYSRPSFHG